MQGEDEGIRSLRIANVARWTLFGVLAAAAAGAWLQSARAGPAAAASTSRYQCPMHPSVVQDGPGQCPICRMALVPATDATGPAPGPAGSVPGLAPVTIPAERTQLIGVNTAAVRKERLAQRLRTTGFVSVDESKIALVTTRFSGWLDELRVQVGERVRKGEILATVSGPEIVTAQQVYLASRRWVPNARGPAVRAGDENDALQRIGVAQQDIDAIARLGRPLRAVPIRAPAAGWVAKRSVLPGLYVEPGAELFQLVDLSSVWVLADLSAQDARLVRLGEPAQLVAGEGAFAGRVDFIHPALDPETRSLRVRVQLANPDLRLRPGIAGALFIDVWGRRCWRSRPSR